MGQESTVRHDLLVPACLLLVFTGTTPLGAQQEEKQAGRTLTIAVQDRVLHAIDPRLFGQFMERPSWGGEIGVEAALTPGTSQLQPQTQLLPGQANRPHCPTLPPPGFSIITLRQHRPG